ncbi:universal stress protein [Ancylomarina sp.]|uniref:universal stress protein n=1 Tax=Ancylomarina sp. TaxID=1970196 RepID=UPI0035659C81
MIENGKTIFVPWDFKGVSEYALDHALFYSSKSKLDVCLIYIVKKEELVKETKIKLDKIAADVLARKGKRVRTIVKVGSFHSGMKEAADENQAAMIFVGIDGFKGIQKYIGTSILNVLSGAVIPSVVVQRPKRTRSSFSLICPIDQRKESKLLLRWIAFLARYIELKVYLVYPEFEEAGQNKKIFRNVAFAKNFLNKEKINFESECFSVFDFNNSIVSFSRKRGIDLILNLTKTELDYRSFFTTPKSHYLIANNEKIPVMCITPTRTGWKFIPFK